MKFNFKKIASVIASTVMLSSTVALAAAANYPAPFVSSGVADVAVVYGASALGTDMIAATDITVNLNSKLVTAGAVTTISGGDFFKIEKSTNKFNLGENFRNIETTLNEDELSNVLAPGIYEDDDGTEYDYDQTITLGGLTLTHFADSDLNADEIPVIGFDVASGTNVLNYTLDFTDSVQNSSALLETTNLKMLGREYYISDWDAANLKMTLLDTANTATVFSDAPISITVGTTTYEVEIVSVNGDDNEAILKVNGEEIDSIIEGNSRKIATDTYLSVLDLKEATRESDKHWVKFSIGTGQIELEDGEDVVINDDTIDGMAVNFDVTSNKINALDLTWTTDDDVFIVPGTDLVMPGFETIKLSMGGFIRPDLEELTVTNSGDDFMQVTGLDLKDGEVKLPILYSNTSKTGFKGLGEASDKLLVTNSSASPTIALNHANKEMTVVATWKNTAGDDWESYAYKLTSIDEQDSGAKNVTKLTNLADSSKTLEFEDTGSGDDKSVGELTFTVSNTNGDTETARLVITADSGTAYADRVITEKGLAFLLPVAVNGAGAATAPGINVLNASVANPTTWIMNFTEADEDNNAAQADGIGFSITLGHTSADGPQVASVSLSTLPTEDGSDDEEGYVSGANGHATKLLFKTGGDNDYVDVEYPGSEAYAEVFISESAAAVTAEGGVSILPITDAESTSAKNLIVVGGSCINTVAAGLLGGALCGADFTATTNVGAGSFLIETFAHGTDGVATLVAGYNAGDTTNAAKYLTTQVVDTTVGKKYTGTSATSATLVVAE